MIMQIVGIGINRMLEECTPHKISSFAELLVNTCRRGAFPINRLWTAYELEQVCVSHLLGCFRIDATLEKFLLTIFVLGKVFIFNMLLQPHKFDVKSFPKG